MYDSSVEAEHLDGAEVVETTTYGYDQEVAADAGVDAGDAPPRALRGAADGREEVGQVPAVAARREPAAHRLPRPVVAAAAAAVPAAAAAAVPAAAAAAAGRAGRLRVRPRRRGAPSSTASCATAR